MPGSSKKPGKVTSDQAAVLEKRDLEATELSRKAAEQARLEAEQARAQVDEKVKTYVEQMRDLEDPSDEEDTAIKHLSQIYERAAARSSGQSGERPAVTEPSPPPVFVQELVPEPDGPVTVRPDKPDTMPRMEKIVIAEDAQDIADSLAETLREEGYSVRIAGDGIDALSKILKGPSPDVLILDIGLPHLSGIGVIAALQTTHLANMPVLIISAASPGNLSQDIRDKYVFIPKSSRLDEDLRDELLKIVAQRVAEWRAQSTRKRR